MEFGIKISLLVFLVFAFSANADNGVKKCSYPAIFNFGDSNSDTGGAYAINHGTNWPNGFSVGHTWKRNSDGRLIIDFLAESLGLPYLNSSLDMVGTGYRYGANFAVGGQRINPDQILGWDLFRNHLDEQVNRFFAFKSLSISNRGSDYFPKPSAFADALYTIDIGQNDVAGLFAMKGASATADYFTKSVERLLKDGAKYLWVHNTCPYGCLPIAINTCPNMYQHTCTLDKYGCITEHNQRSQDFNSELKKRIDLLRRKYPMAVITLVDMYSAKYNLLNHVQGFDDNLKLKYCCGKTGEYCGTTGDTCQDPSKYLNWDGTHYTQAANKYLANQIISGSYSEPRTKLAESCIRH